MFDSSLCFKEHDDYVIMKAHKGLSARVMADASIKQRLLVVVLLYQGLVLSATEYASAIVAVV